MKFTENMPKEPGLYWAIAKDEDGQPMEDAPLIILTVEEPDAMHQMVTKGLIAKPYNSDYCYSPIWKYEVLWGGLLEKPIIQTNTKFQA